MYTTLCRLEILLIFDAHMNVPKSAHLTATTVLDRNAYV